MGEQAKRRPRHDGWTEARRVMFLATLTETGRVRDACRAAGLSFTSAYRTRRAHSDFAERWDMALARRTPILEQVAFDRAVRGVEEPLVAGVAVVATKRRYSDALLRFLIERDDKRRADEGARGYRVRPLEEVQESILAKLAAMDEHEAAKKREEQLAFAERMRREGWAP